MEKIKNKNELVSFGEKKELIITLNLKYFLFLKKARLSQAPYSSCPSGYEPGSSVRYSSTDPFYTNARGKNHEYTFEKRN